MRIKKRRRLHNQRRTRILRAMAWLLGFLLLVVGIDIKIRPVVRTMCEYQAQLIGNKSINGTIADLLAEKGLQYGDLVQIQYLEDGSVASIQTNSVQVNLLKAELTDRIQTQLTSYEMRNLNIPLGTLLGGEFFMGRGPKVPFRMTPVGTIQTSLTNEVDAAGINQTRHQMMLHVQVKVSALVPGHYTTTVLQTDYCIAETVIVGKVPESFTQVYDGESDLAGSIADYGAGEQWGR